MNNINLIILLLIFLIITLITIILLVKYNNLIKLNIKINDDLNNINSLQKRRWEMLPNFISIIRNSTDQMPKHLEDLIKIKNNLYDKKTDEEKNALNKKLDETLSTLILELKKDRILITKKEYQDVFSQLSDIENYIKESKIKYNKHVKILNDQIQVFPNKYIAKHSGLTSKESLDLSSLQNNSQSN